MVSANIKGAYALYIESPTGERRLIKKADSAYWTCSGLGSSEGVISTTATPEKLNFLPLSKEAGTAGYKLVCTLTAASAATADASDAVAIIPVMVDGQMQTIGGNGQNGIGNDNFVSVLAAGDYAYVAGVETPVWSIRAVEGVKQFRVGGDKVFMSIENNA